MISLDCRLKKNSVLKSSKLEHTHIYFLIFNFVSDSDYHFKRVYVERRPEILF